MRAVRRLVVAVLVVAGSTVASPLADSSPSTEVQTLAAINQGRAAVGKPPLVMHAGLRLKQREHSQNMSVLGALTHDGAENRFDTATPDPAEANGPRDDGFTGSWCENVARRMVPGESESAAAAGFFDQWLNSPPHRRCMLDEDSAGYNAAGIGIFQDASGERWAALILVVDNSAPSGGGGTTPPPPSTSPGNPPPTFSAASPCSSVVMTPFLSGATTIGVSASDGVGQTVSLSASGLPAFASFTSTPGNPAQGTITASPSIFDWITGLIGGASHVTITATDNGLPAPSSSACQITLRVNLLPGLPI